MTSEESQLDAEMTPTEAGLRKAAIKVNSDRTNAQYSLEPTSLLQPAGWLPLSIK